MSSEPDAYLHGFTDEEQRRLESQAGFLAPWVYRGLELPERGLLLEVGAGVGAQTGRLLERTGATVVALERDERQLAALRRNLAGPLAQGRATAVGGDARALPLRAGALAGAYICWVLEHVPGPGEVLREVRWALAPGAQVVAIEVQNGSLTVLPRQPALERYWEAVNRTQADLGGDPYVGVRLGGLLHRAGFEQVQVEWVPVQGDARDPAGRLAILDYFHSLLRSATASVRAHGLAWPGMEAELDAAFAALRADPDSAFLYTFARVTGRRPEGP